MPYILQQLLTNSAKQHPDKPAVLARGRSLTYRELNERSNQVAHLLRSRGVQKVSNRWPQCSES
jgi:non-ribosomal peptide synthetase component F